MKYFVRIDKTIIVVNSLKRAKELANTYAADEEVKYVDYGAVDLDDWAGNSVIAVIKNVEESSEE